MTNPQFIDWIREAAQLKLKTPRHHKLPAWSTGEWLAVALVTNDESMLRVEGYTALEAMDRLAGEVTIEQLRAIQRELDL